MDTENNLMVVYQNFLKHFLENVNPNDQLPVNVNNYNITRVEVIGDVIDWILQYLDSWKCPQSLKSPLARDIVNKVSTVLNPESSPEYFNKDSQEYSAIKLMQHVIKVVRCVCESYVDNEKITSLACNPTKNYISHFAVKNRRRCMEDRHVIIHDLQKLFDIKGCGTVNYYAVFDGHNGYAAATYSAGHLHQYMAESQFYPMYPEQALCEAFKATDKYLLEKIDPTWTRSGTTAACILWHKTDKMLYVAWVGDSEAMLARNGKIYPLIKPHKAEREDERKRIQELGGVVLYWQSTWRVNGQLAITRAIGDSDHKQCIISVPDIATLQLKGDEDFIILACDGLWDCVSYEEAAHAVYKQILTAPDQYDEVSNLLVQLAKTKGSEDNITVVVVYLSDPHHIKLSNADMETATAESFSPKQNGSSYCSINNLQGNFDAEDDFGPETNIDNIDDGLLSQQVSTKKSFTNFENLNNGFAQQTENNIEKGTKEAEVDSVDNNTVLSDESDEDEWNYMKGEGEANSKSNNHPNSLTIENNTFADENMDYALNPDAAEFVPVSPSSTKSGSRENVASPIALNEFAPDVRQRLLCEDFVASSPLKGHEKSMENVEVPALNEFDKEIRRRPSNILPDMENAESNFNNDASFWNDGDVCPLKKEDVSLLENTGKNDTLTSTNAVFGDESTYSQNLQEINEAFEEHMSNGTRIDESHEVELSAPELQNNKSVSNGDMFENEDYPSIIESKTSTSDEVNDMGFSNVKNEYEDPFKSIQEESHHQPMSPPAVFDDISAHLHDDTESVIRDMADFSEPAPPHSIVMVDEEPVLQLNDKAPSPIDDLICSKVKKSSNPFVLPNEEEKENAEEKDIEEDGDDFCIRGREREICSPAKATDPFEFEMKSTHVSDFQTEKQQLEDVFGAQPQVKVEPVQPNASQTVDPMMMSQILDADQLQEGDSNVTTTQDANVTSSSSNLTNGEEELMSQYDAEAPFRHDCSRISQKPDSVHETAESKHYEDLLPDFNNSAQESDKLESELRESEAKSDFSPVVDVTEEALVCERKPSIQVEAITDTQEVAISPLSSVPAPVPVSEAAPVQERDAVPAVGLAAAAVAAAAVTVPIVAEAKKDPKKSASKKVEEKKSPAKTPATTKSLASPSAKKPALTRVTAEKKPATTTMAAKAAPRPLASAPRPLAPKTSTAASKTAPSKSAITTAAKDRSSTTVSSTVARSTTAAAAKLSASPVKARPATTTTKTNGELSSAKPMTAKKITASTTAPKRSLIEATSSAAAAPKPSVNLSTRTSLAPARSKPAPSSTPKPSTTTTTTSATKRPATAPTKVVNKDSKDLTNKRLLTTKSSPTKTNSLVAKTESKVNSGLKSSPRPLNSTAIKKPSTAAATAASPSAANQSEVTQHQNGNA